MSKVKDQRMVLFKIVVQVKIWGTYCKSSIKTPSQISHIPLIRAVDGFLHVKDHWEGPLNHNMYCDCIFFSCHCFVLSEFPLKMCPPFRTTTAVSLSSTVAPGRYPSETPIRWSQRAMQLRCSERLPSTTHFTSVTLSSDQLSISARGHSLAGCFPCSCLVTTSAGFSCSTCSALGVKHTVMRGASLTRVAWLTWHAPPLAVSVARARQRSTALYSLRSLNGGATTWKEKTNLGRSGARDREPVQNESAWRICLQKSWRLWYDTFRMHVSVRYAWIVRLLLLSALVVTWFVVWIVQPCVRNARYAEVRLPMHRGSSSLASERRLCESACPFYVQTEIFGT